MYDWTDYLVVAELLLERIGGEGAERSAISRAYYACYSHACAYARQNRAPLTSTGSDHRVVWDWFDHRSGPGTAHANVAQYGRRLKRWRTLADYREEFSRTATTSRLALATARQHLAALDGLA